VKIDGVVFTNAFADTTFLLFEVNTAFIDVGNQGDCLGEKYMDGFILGYTGAIFLDNVSGFLRQGNLKIPCFALYAVNFRMGKNLYVWMPADLDQFG
jgi:hypothetical protein